jgi:L-glutamine-phosphate cytidylyltransferase
MKAIILAAGRGSRMKRLTDEQPKCLVKVKGKTLLQREIEALKEAGIGEIAIVTGYKRELLAAPDRVEFHNPRWQETNMVSSLACAQDWLASEPCIISYSDIFYRASAVKSLMESQADIAVTFDPNWLGLWTSRFGNPLLDAETFRLGADGFLSEIGNKPKTVEEVQGQYMGLLRITPKGWEEILEIRSGLPHDERDRMHMTGTLQRVIQSGRIKVLGLPYTGDWGEVDSDGDLSHYQ